MKLEFFEKPVITAFVKLNDEEFEVSKLYVSLEEILETDYALRDYEFSYPSVMDKLVEMGIVDNYMGSREANLYCVKDKEKVEELIDEIYKNWK